MHMVDLIFFLSQASPSDGFIEHFNLVLTQYTAALQCIVPVFIYMVTLCHSYQSFSVLDLSLPLAFMTIVEHAGKNRPLSQIDFM